VARRLQVSAEATHGVGWRRAMCGRSLPCVVAAVHVLCNMHIHAALRPSGCTIPRSGVCLLQGNGSCTAGHERASYLSASAGVGVPDDTPFGAVAGQVV